MISEQANAVFRQAIADYHDHDNIDQPITNPYPLESLEHLFYLKCWIDTTQWHMEDIIRNPEIKPEEALYWKRRIDQSNQDRTDTVEYIDSYFLQKFTHILPKANAKLNSETPAWAIDRLSILALKIYHMEIEATRSDASRSHREQCQNKLNILKQQQKDLSQSIDELIEDISKGVKFMKVYKQMKMYNDPELNPILYTTKK